MVLRYATEVIFCPCTATSRGWGKARKFEYSDFSITRVFCAYMYTQQKRRQPFNLSLQTILKNGRPISPRRDVYFRSRMTARVLRSAATKQRLSRRTERRWSFFLFFLCKERGCRMDCSRGQSMERPRPSGTHAAPIYTRVDNTCIPNAAVDFPHASRLLASEVHYERRRKPAAPTGMR